MCKRNSPHKYKSQHGMCKRNSLDKKEEKKATCMGCVRVTPQRKIKQVWDV